MAYYVGLDVHSKACSFVFQSADGMVVGHGEVATTAAGFQQLVRAHGLPGGTPVALETGTVAFFVARECTAVGLVPHVIDAHEVRLKAYRPRQQSDRRDAHELCEGLRRGIYRTRVHVPPLPVARLRETLSRRRSVTYPMKPGDVAFFDCFVPHQSGPNLTDQPRRNLYLTFNRKRDGDHREEYFADKRRNFPPDFEREPVKTYEFKV